MSSSQDFCTPPNLSVLFPDLIGPTGPTGPIPASSIRPDIGSWSDLAGIATVSLSVPQIVIWFETATNILRITRLQASTAANDNSNGIQRPNDYDGSVNQKVWFSV